MFRNTVNRLRYKSPNEALILGTSFTSCQFVINSPELFQNFMHYQSSLRNKLVLLGKSDYNEQYPYKHRNF